ncbi:Transposase_28 domain-containing protein [Cephalotus follicularis]|uniref:Transposase_28 domain-containing protein n=1 Tax=Cephalotus follicularis TaxID=3775 RepID=A0A1Q3B6G8_CEPFO|nr:Transposase_28 domain-containing protein [Cephalotus follicularis]
MVTESRPDYFVVFQDALEHGLRLPLPPFALTILRHYQVHPSMLQAQSWGFIMGFLVRCLEAGVTATVALFEEFYTITSSPKKRGFYFKSRAGHNKLLAENTKTVKSWREKYFMVKNLPDFTPSPWSDTLDTVALS